MLNVEPRGGERSAVCAPWWRHEQQTVAAVLATVTHHSHSKVGTAYDAPRSQNKVTSTRVGPAEYKELSSDDGRPTGGERPAAVLEPWLQGKMERHDGIAYELVQALDSPVLQTVEQLLNVVQFFSTQLPVVAEPVIAVPKILPHDVPPRRLCRDTQLAKQPVEVSTILYFLKQRIPEQIVDNPASVLRHARRTGSQAYFVLDVLVVSVFGGGGGGRWGAGYVGTVYEMACFLFHVQYPQCKLCRRLFLRRRPCDQQWQVLTVQTFETSCPRFTSSSEWWTFLLCNRLSVEIPQVQFLDKVEICPLLRRQVQFSWWSWVEDMPVYVQRQVLSF